VSICRVELDKTHLDALAGSPGVAILAIGALRTKTYDPTDRQAFAHGRHGGNPLKL